MKKQRLVTHYDRIEFDTLVNSYLNNGYTVVPGTLIVSNSVCNFSKSGDSHGNTGIQTIELLAVVLEKEV